MRPWLVLVLAVSAFGAQAPALEFAGTPVRVPLACSEDDMRAFGMSCPPEQPCPVYLELTGIEPLGTRLFAIGNLHTESATLFSIVLASDDGGKTWREPAERIRSATLDGIQFFDLENGWIGGEVAGALPRDPFLLVTNDSGKTWRARPVTSESRVASLEGFVFRSKSEGTLWIDRTSSGDSRNRYETYETQTGGESWALKEVSEQPISKKPKPPADSGWRLRADGATRAYHIEKRAGPKWETVASFLIAAGECKEAEASVPAPGAHAEGAR